MSGRVSSLGVRMSTPGGDDKENGPDVSLDALMDKAAGKSSVPGGAPKVCSAPEGLLLGSGVGLSNFRER